MSGADLVALLPLVVMGAVVLAVTLAAALFRRPQPGLGLAGSVLALAALAPATLAAPRQVTALFVVDGTALLFMGLVLAATSAVLLLSRRRPADMATPVLLPLAALGAMAVVASGHFASFFLGLETLSIALVGLIVAPDGHARSLEAGIKYLVLAGLSSALLLFGIALVYLRFGTLAFAEIASRHGAAADVVWLVALALLVAGIGFKLSLVPFHLWAPDVYQGAPPPVAGFIAVVSKGAVFALLLRYFQAIGAAALPPTMTMIEVTAVASMLAGNLLALMQTDIRRLLGYSSIAHLGTLLVVLLLGGGFGVEAAAFYLVAYTVTTLGAFGVVTMLESSGEADYRGLIRRRPWLGCGFALMLLSLAGMPPTLGFFAKMAAMAAGIGAAAWPAVAALVVGSVIGLFYYLRVIVVMLGPAPGGDAVEAPTAWPAAAVVAVLATMLVWLGILPSPLLRLIHAAAARGLS